MGTIQSTKEILIKPYVQIIALQYQGKIALCCCCSYGFSRGYLLDPLLNLYVCSLPKK